MPPSPLFNKCWAALGRTFWRKSRSFFGLFSDLYFYRNLSDFCIHFGADWPPKATSEALGRPKVDLQKHRFSLSKTILFELGGCPGPTKFDFRNAFEIWSVFLWTSDTLLSSKWHQKGTPEASKSNLKSCFFLKRDLETILEPKWATGDPTGCWAEPWGRRF